MNIPKARKLSSGKWFIQMRLGGESVSVSDFDKKACEREAMRLKAEHKAGKRVPKENPVSEKPFLTLDQAIDDYCKSKNNVLSPATIRGYQNIRKNQLKEIMKENIYDLAELPEEDWQKIINRESSTHSPKTVKNSVSFAKTIVQGKTKKALPSPKIAAPVAADTSFLYAEEIPVFVAAVMKTDIAVPALLALSSMRLSEIQALDWKNIKKDPDFIRTNGAVVPDENNKLIHKDQNKNITSARDVPILIPELKDAIKRDRKESGPVLDCSRSYFLKKVHSICQQNNITDVTIHGLRHSFASLAYYLKVPEKIAMEIGGWADSATMHKIYTHIAKKDITRYKTEIADFYNGKIANKNANKENQH